ncbi:MAG: M16 family metallopeptidase [Blastocatellia bacterium]
MTAESKLTRLFIHFFIVVLLAVMPVAVANAQARKPRQPAKPAPVKKPEAPPAETPAPAPETGQGTLPAGENTIEFFTSNGLKVIFRQVQGNEVVAAQVYFRGGSRNINEKNAGIESLLWDVAQESTKNFSKGVIDRETARMGTIIDSGGGYDYSVMAMQCVRQHFDRSWQLLTDMILNPLLDDKEIALERDRMVNALRQEADDPDNAVTSLGDRLMYKAHPYMNRPFGTIETVGKLTAADLRAHHAAQLQTSRMLVVVVGSVPVDDVRRKMETAFGKLPKGEYKPEPAPAFEAAGRPDVQIVNRTVPTQYVRGVFAAPALGHPDYPAMMVMASILSNQFFEEVRVKRNLSYAPSAELNSTSANTGFIYVTTPQPNEAMRVMFAEIDRVQQMRIRDEALQNTITGFLTQYYQKLETNSAQAARLGEYELTGGGWRRALTWIDDVRRVTPADLNRVANTYLKNFHFALLGDQRTFDRNLFLSR